ncbi:MAG TPA: PAS domain-containing protein, partial [Nitrospira sp.]|nr:PAS domain-containing protein [Nitrospira sp.]
MEDFPRNTIDDSPTHPPFTDFGAWDWDIISGDVQWFGTHERLIGMQTKSLSGKVEAFSHVLHPDDRARVWKKVLGMMARRETQYSDQFRFLYSNGTARWMSGTGRFSYDDSGRPVRMAGVVQDVTAVRRQEQALCDSEERFARAFRSSPHPIGITEVATGRCIEVNDA